MSFVADMLGGGTPETPDARQARLRKELEAIDKDPKARNTPKRGLLQQEIDRIEVERELARQSGRK